MNGSFSAMSSALAAALLTTTSVFADTWNVPADFDTIQAAIDAASDGDCILVADGTYAGDGNRDIDFGGRVPRFQAMLERFEGSPGSTEHPSLERANRDLARCLLRLGRPAEALPHAREAMAIHRRRLKVDTRDTSENLTLVASCRAALGRSEEALPEYEEAIEINRRVLPPGHPDAIHTQLGMAGTLVRLGRYEDAEPFLLDAAGHCDRSEAARWWHWHTVREESIRLYETWDAAEPGQGYDVRAAKWRATITDRAELADEATGRR